jgi:hypothetical protein
MKRIHRVLAYAITAISTVAVGTFAPDPCLFDILLLGPVIGIALVAIVLGRCWHTNDARTRCGFISMIAGLASIPVCGSYQT